MSPVIKFIFESFKNLYKFLAKNYNHAVNRLIFYFNNTHFPSDLTINGTIYLRNKGHLTLGEKVIINSNLRSNPIGGDQRTLMTILDKARLSIGNHVGISNSTFFCTKEIIIEDFVNIGGNCKLYDTDFHSLKFEHRVQENPFEGNNSSIIIRKGAWIGGHVIILKGVEIGMYSIIGAGSVVTKNVPPREIWAGNPAKFIKSYDEIFEINS